MHSVSSLYDNVETSYRQDSACIEINIVIEKGWNPTLLIVFIDILAQ